MKTDKQLEELNQRVENFSPKSSMIFRGFIRFIGIVLIIMSLLLLIVQPIFGIIGIAFGIFLWVMANKLKKSSKENPSIKVNSVKQNDFKKASKENPNIKLNNAGQRLQSNKDIICKKEVVTKYNSLFIERIFSIDTPDTFVAIDLETTGLNPQIDEIIQVGAIKYENGVEVDRFTSYVKATIPISPQASKVNKIYDYMLEDAPDIKYVLKLFVDFISGYNLIAHNASFDMKFLQTSLKYCEMEILSNNVMDTLELARKFLSLSNYKLTTIGKYYGMKANMHEALGDCSVCAKIYLDFLEHNKEELENRKPVFDEPTDDLYFCALDDAWYSCCEIGWYVDYGKFHKVDIRPEIEKVCAAHNGRCYKSKAKSAKYIIILCNPMQTKDRVKKWHNMGYKVVSLDIALKYFGIYEQTQKITERINM